MVPWEGETAFVLVTISIMCFWSWSSSSSNKPRLHLLWMDAQRRKSSNSHTCHRVHIFAKTIGDKNPDSSPFLSLPPPSFSLHFHNHNHHYHISTYPIIIIINHQLPNLSFPLLLCCAIIYMFFTCAMCMYQYFHPLFSRVQDFRREETLSEFGKIMGDLTQNICTNKMLMNEHEHIKIDQQQQEEVALRWGIAGCGRISGDFVRAMGYCLKPNKILAVASENGGIQNAQEFCHKYGLIELDGTASSSSSTGDVVVQCYGTYGELFANPNIDIIYVANINPKHKKTVLGALDAGKHVLCEKPIGINCREVEEMVLRARKRGRFLMEAYWTRCFPLWRELSIGQTYSQDWPSPNRSSRFWICQQSIDYIEWRVDSTEEVKEGGEGYLLSTGCYGLIAIQMVLGGKTPVEIVAKGGRKEGRNGFDIWSNIFLRYPDDQQVGQMFYSGRHKTLGSMAIHGQKGNIRIPEFFWSPVEAHIQLYPQNANAIRQAGLCPIEKILHPLPAYDPNLFHCPHTVGLFYEIDHVWSCVRAGKTESDWMGLDESIEVAKIMDECRRQLGVRYPQDRD